MLGKPVRMKPVFICATAGIWFALLETMVRMTVSLSAHCARFGNKSLT